MLVSSIIIYFGYTIFVLDNIAVVHGSLTSEQRTDVAARFRSGEILIVCATSAFEMVFRIQLFVSEI